jgi:bifunctional non-homologous end joining protein LigD
VLDGEAVCCDTDGVADFELLCSRTRDDRVFLYAFDVPELGGVKFRVERLEERRGRLQYLMRNVTHPGVQYNEHIEGDGATIFEHACRLGSRASSRNTARTPTDRGRASRRPR